MDFVTRWLEVGEWDFIIVGAKTTQHSGKALKLIPAGFHNGVMDS